jgi:anti-anti-sigma factor
VPLRLNRRTLGCLNLFIAEPVALPISDVALAQALADVASIAISHHPSSRPPGISDDHLHHALTSRIAIEQAKGMIAAHDKGDMHAAFARLRTFAADHHRGLTDVAEALVAGTLAVESLTPTIDPRPTAGNPDHSALAPHLLTQDGDQVIHPRGELDMATSTACIDACFATGYGTLVVDLSEVTFMDCSAYGAFVAAHLELERQGGTLTLRNPTGQPARLLALITQLDHQDTLACAPRSLQWDA